MRHPHHRILFVGLVFACLISFLQGQVSTDMGLLRAQWLAARARVLSPIDQAHLKVLGKLQNDLTKDGKLDQASLVQAQSASISEQLAEGAGALIDVRVEGFFIELKKPMEKWLDDRSKATRALDEKYLKMLEQIKTDQAKGGDLARSLQADGELIKVGAATRLRSPYALIKALGPTLPFIQGSPIVSNRSFQLDQVPGDLARLSFHQHIGGAPNPEKKLVVVRPGLVYIGVFENAVADHANLARLGFQKTDLKFNVVGGNERQWRIYSARLELSMTLPASQAFLGFLVLADWKE